MTTEQAISLMTTSSGEAVIDEVGKGVREAVGAAWSKAAKCELVTLPRARRPHLAVRLLPGC